MNMTTGRRTRYSGEQNSIVTFFPLTNDSRRARHGPVDSQRNASVTTASVGFDAQALRRTEDDISVLAEEDQRRLARPCLRAAWVLTFSDCSGSEDEHTSHLCGSNR